MGMQVYVQIRKCIGFQIWRKIYSWGSRKLWCSQKRIMKIKRKKQRKMKNNGSFIQTD